MLRRSLREADGNTSVREFPSDVIRVDAEIAHCAAWSRTTPPPPPPKMITYNPINVISVLDAVEDNASSLIPKRISFGSYLCDSGRKVTPVASSVAPCPV